MVMKEVTSIIQEGCRTPRHTGSRIPPATACPPAPKKKPPVYHKRQKVVPKSGYFVPPDLELIFRVLPPTTTREAFA